jgi:hypothetical protein
MPKIVEPTTTDDEPEAQRAVIRESISEIAAEVGTALCNAHLDFPVFLSVPEQAMQRENLQSRVQIVVPSRHSLVTIGGTRNMPPDDWSRLSSILCEVIGQKLSREGLRGRPLARAMATPKSNAGDVTPD